MHLINEVLQHLLSYLEVCDNAVLQWPDGGDITWRSPQHALSVGTHSCNSFLTIVRANRNHRRLIQNDALFAHIDQCISRA